MSDYSGSQPKLCEDRIVPDTSTDKEDRLDAVVVGAGFAGLYMLHKLRRMGLSTRILEAGSGVGGTWYWNRYPGARCDVPSLHYSYQFSDELQQEWEWTERYSTQPEILEYANHVADRFELRPYIQFDTRVAEAVFDEEEGCWRVVTEAGQQLRAVFCIMATGCLSAANDPKFKGRDSFQGDWYHTGRWPHEGVDFAGKRVGVIGTGSSGIQSIPLIAEQAEHLTVFQRTPNYSVPAHNALLDADLQRDVKSRYAEFRARDREQAIAFDVEANELNAADMSPEELRAECERRWKLGGLYFFGTFADMLEDQEANDVIARFVRDKIREKVKDPKTADLLSPDFVFGCKRICADTDYFETFNRDNVTLVDISSAPIEEITADGLRVADEQYTLDAIVSATGFDAMTGSLERIDIRGIGGQALKDKWSAGPRTYLGLATAGFPNFFIISGPGSPSVFTNMITSIEQHVEFIADCVDYMRERGLARVEATVEAEDDWVDHVNEVAEGTLLLGCNSWYLGANVPGKPRVFMPYVGFPPYVEKCESVAANEYEGFRLS
jgi:cyclohexanone monooxygenase